jgi:DNA polymerase-1
MAVQMYRIVTEVGEVRKYLSGFDKIAFDIETAPLSEYRNEDKAALGPHKAFVVGISFSVSEGTGIYIPLRHKQTEKNTSDTVGIWSAIAETLTSEKITKIAHNAAFEVSFLYGLGVFLCAPVYDTIAAAQMTAKSKTEFRSLADSGLKTLVPQLLKVELPKYEDVVGNRFFDELDPTDAETIRYACADSDYTLRLYHLFNGWFDRVLPKHRFIVEQIESPVAVYCGIMKYNGIGVDKAMMYQKQFEAEDRIRELRKEIHGIIGGVDIGANAATDEFKGFLYKELKLPVLKTTAKYQSAADEEAIILLKDWCRDNNSPHLPLLELVQEYRKWNKIKSTYIDAFINSINGATGRIHTSFFPLGTDTGRFASRYPNLQNMPRKDNDPVGIRNFFVPSEGHLFLDFDFSQIELRVGAWYCKDPKMLEVYRTGGDIHAQTTAVLYGITNEEAADKSAPHFKERRSIAKNCNFGIFYGLFANGLMRNLKKAGVEKTKPECERIIRNLKDGYPGLVTWQDKTRNQAANDGYSETALGRRRALAGINSPNWSTRSYWERRALNTPIQGTAADILKLAMARILEGLTVRPWLKPVITIHDELLFEVPADKVDEAAEYIKSCMEQQPFPTFDVPLVAEGAKGYKFGEMEEAPLGRV